MRERKGGGAEGDTAIFAFCFLHVPVLWYYSSRDHFLLYFPN